MIRRAYFPHYGNYGISGWRPAIPWPGATSLSAPITARSGSCQFSIELRKNTWPYMVLVDAAYIEVMAENLLRMCWMRRDAGLGIIDQYFSPVMGLIGTKLALRIAPVRNGEDLGTVNETVGGGLMEMDE